MCYFSIQIDKVCPRQFSIQPQAKPTLKIEMRPAARGLVKRTSVLARPPPSPLTSDVLYGCPLMVL